MSTEPHSKTQLGYAEYVCFPDDGKRHEIIEGEHYMNPAPSTNHQTVSRRIQFSLYSQIELKELGQVFNAPVDLQLNEHNIVQPDIVIVLEAKRQIITPTKIKGIPDLIIEILSPTSTKNDCVLKRQVYETAGVPEYWIVDPIEHEVQQLVLASGKYVPREHGDTIILTVLKNVSVNLNEVW